jgi:hypothetical protein
VSPEEFELRGSPAARGSGNRPAKAPLSGASSAGLSEGRDGCFSGTAAPARALANNEVIVYTQASCPPGQQTLPHLPPPPCPASLSCSVFCYRDWHTFSGTLHFSGLLQAPQLAFHFPFSLSLPQLLRRPLIQLVPQLLGGFLYLALTSWLVHGILAAEKLSRLDCASIPISSRALPIKIKILFFEKVGSLLFLIICLAFAASTSYLSFQQCDSDPLADRVADEFVEGGLEDMTIRGAGFKNTYFGHPGVDSVLRMSFSHSALCDFVGPIYKIFVGRFPSPVGDSNFSKVLGKVFDLWATVGRKERGVESENNIYCERFNSVLPSLTPGLIFGTNSEISFHRICVQQSSSSSVEQHFSANKGKMGEPPCHLKEPIRLNIGVYRAVSGSAEHFFWKHKSQRDPFSFSAVDLLVLSVGYFHDLLRMYTYHGWFPADAHPGNLLVNSSEPGLLSFVWSDFGQTNQEENVPSQARRAIRAMCTELTQALKYPFHTGKSFGFKADDVRSALSDIRPPLESEDGNIGRYLESMTMSVESASFALFRRHPGAFAEYSIRVGSVSRHTIAGLLLDMKEQKVLNGMLQADMRDIEAKMEEQKDRSSRLEKIFDATVKKMLRRKSRRNRKLRSSAPSYSNSSISHQQLEL